MADFARVSGEGWRQGDDSSAQARVGADGWWQIAGGGGTSVTVDGQTVTSAATIIAGAVSTTANATANGQTLVAAATLIGGGASAGGAVTVDGQTLTAAGSLIAGAVTTTQSITVAGITANAAATLIGGGASTPIPGVGGSRRSSLSLGLGIYL